MHASTGLRRLSVQADNISIDMALSAAVPVESLIPSITDVLAAAGNFTIGPTATRYELSAIGGITLDASKTLAELEIRDGTVLTLARSTMVSPPAAFDDAAEAVSAAIADVERPWTQRASRLVGAFTATSLAGVSAVVLWRTTTGVGVAATIGVLTLLAAAVAYRVGEDGAGLTSGLTATVFTALAGWVAVPGDPGAARAVFAAAAAATTAALIRVIARHAAIFTTLACCAATCFVAASVCVVTTAPVPAVGVGLAAASLALIEASPSMSIAIARLSSASVDDQLQATGIRAHTLLTSLIAALSASATLGAIGALCTPSPPHIAYTTAVGGALLLRARTRHDIRHSAPSIVCGTVTLSAALVVAAVANPPHALHIASLSMTLSVVALYAGFMSSTLPATARRGADLLQYFALATVGPLAFWLCGLYRATRDLSLP